MSDQLPSSTPEPRSEAEQLILELERRANALQQQQEEEPLVSLLTFNLSEEWFALPLDKIKVVSRLLDVTPVPGTSRYVLGVINHKSAIYPVIDVHELLSLDPQMPTRSSRFIIVQHEKYTFAMLVDAMAEVREVRQRELELQMGSSKHLSTYVSSELNIENRLLGLLNLDTILYAVVEGSANENKPME
jgi:purine-binding chemotaxis protein CheW